MRRPKQVQKPANTDLPHTRPRPGRRRHHNALLPLSFTYTFLLTLPMLLSLLCITTEASDQQSSPGRIVRQRFAERKILFDDKPPELYRRGDSTASLRAIAAPTATGSDSATISIISESTSTSSALPKAFDGGLGTNYTKPSCPTFLRSMVNDDTFISCVPFSLLLRVKPPRRPTHPLRNFSKTNPHFLRIPCPSSPPRAPDPTSPTSSTPPAASPNRPARTLCPATPSASAPPPPARPTTIAKTRKSATPTPASWPTPPSTTPRASPPPPCRPPRQTPGGGRTMTMTMTTTTTTASPPPSRPRPTPPTPTSTTSPSAPPSPPAAGPPAIPACAPPWPASPSRPGTDPSR